MAEGSKPVPEELKKLVFLVARLFYEPRCVIILDIMTHVDSIKDEDLSAMIKIPTKELHKICGKLLEDKFIQMLVDKNLNEN
jgi:transcription initiation factor TFIIE subunit alpha